ncbi:hypothetical protein D3C87_2039180 [compost metagenome]
MQRFQLFRLGRNVFDLPLAGFGIEQTPQLADKAVGTVDTIRIPRLRLIQRAEEHFV